MLLPEIFACVTRPEVELLCSAAQHQQSTADSPHLLSQTHTRTHVHLQEHPDRYSHFRYVGAKLLLCVKII